MPDYPEIRMYIDGEWCAGDGDRLGDIVCPANGEIIGYHPFATAVDVARSISAAARAFPLWRDMPVSDREFILKTAAHLLRERSLLISEIVTMEQGKPLGEALSEARRTADTLEWNIEEARRSYGRTIPSDRNTILSVVREPVGPVAAFVPWNFPAGGPIRKLAAALAAGCSIVLKASEKTPGSACQIVECLEQAGVPAGVVNLIFGDPEMISRQLIGAPAIRMIAFTGSVEVGKLLLEQAARVMKPTLMELGGHAPVIVCADADPVTAARRSATGKFANAGQVCTSPTRFYVHESVYDAFLAELVAAARAIKVGNGFAPGVQMGPLISEVRLRSISQTVDEAIAAGARLEIGGHRIGERGWFYAPTILSDVPEHCRIMQEEPFGPVALVNRFTDPEQAMALANSLPYGLAAYAFTQNAADAHALATGLEAGLVSINHTSTSANNAPAGGVKESGHGREGGAEALDAYVITKRISHKLN